MSKEDVKNLFKDGVTTWEEKTMHNMIDKMYTEKYEKDGKIVFKSDDGYMMVVGQSKFNADTTNKYGDTGLRYAKKSCQFKYPESFKEPPYVFTEVRSDGRVMMVGTGTTGTRSEAGEIVAFAAWDFNAPFIVDVIAIGKWK